MRAGLPLLLADDDASNRLTLAALLEDEGFVVTTAASGDEVRAVLASGEPVRVAVVDLHLADEDGVAIAAAVRRRFPGAAVFIHSGDPAQPDRMEGIDGWLVKGAPVQETVEAIRSASKTARSV